MRKPDPPFPSFTLMMNQYSNDSLRLPSYRESLVIRYHPYARKQTKTADRLMQKVDYRYEEPAPVPNEEDTSTLSPDTVEGIALNLDRAMSRDGTVEVKRRRSLTSLIIDLALAVRDGYRSSRIGKKPSFALKPKED
ncbi:hypothetical protein BV20DRAFT_400886 [Pilatotrama ljubarskyi]|nr:hypothetical protein BV20DRAFT_400886 [Pilatotrama ljubarskyi]